jgi:hypothetical protein
MTELDEFEGSFTKRQQLFLRFTFAVLVDLTVLNLFNQYWDYVYIEDFSISLFTAILLQFLLQVTIKFEHYVASFFEGKPGVTPKILRFLSAWAILFASKLTILQAINFSFGDSVLFLGPYHGLVSFILVVIVIIAAEQLISWTYRSLGQG